MAIPFALPNYVGENELQLHRFLCELYEMLRIFLRQNFELPCEFVYWGTLPGLRVRVGVRPSATFADVTFTTNHEASPVSLIRDIEQSPASGLQTDHQEKPDTNDPEGGTT